MQQEPEDPARGTDPTTGRIKDIRVYRDSFVGMSMLACVPFLIFGALKVYGWLAAIGLFLLWVVLVGQGTRWFLPHPRRVIYLALASFGSWLVAVLVSR